MKFKKIAAVLVFGLSANTAPAQTPAAPAPPDSPAASPSPPPTPPSPPAEKKPSVVEGILVTSQRANNDKGKFEWICTYRVANSRRSVQLEESCPATLPFQLKR